MLVMAAARKFAIFLTKTHHSVKQRWQPGVGAGGGVALPGQQVQAGRGCGGARGRRLWLCPRPDLCQVAVPVDEAAGVPRIRSGTP